MNPKFISPQIQTNCYHVSGKDAEGLTVTVQVFATNKDSAFIYAKNMRPDCTFNNAQIQIP